MRRLKSETIQHGKDIEINGNGNGNGNGNASDNGTVLNMKKTPSIRIRQRPGLLPLEKMVAAGFVCTFTITLLLICFLPSNQLLKTPIMDSGSTNSHLKEEISTQIHNEIQPLESELAKLNGNLKELIEIMHNANNTIVLNNNNNVQLSEPNPFSPLNPSPPSSPKKISVFFNTFQKVNDTGTSYEVIYDQVKTLNQGLLKKSTVYYSRFGDLKLWPTTKCVNKGNRECVEIAAKEDGDESITLQHLYNFCTKNLNDRVVYIHSKGTYTHSWNNRILKKILMKAVSSEACLRDMGNNGMDCNTCSSQFAGFPAHYPGNMWVADCDYISELIPPEDFEQKKSEVAQRMMNATKRIVPDSTEDDRWKTELDDGTVLTFKTVAKWMMDRPSWLGTQRYAMEHWLASSPRMKPCDAFSPKDGIPTFSYDTIKQKHVFADDMTPKLQTAPGVPFRDHWTHPFRLHPWYKPGGKLYEYNALYSETPSESSWFHQYWHKAPKYS